MLYGMICKIFGFDKEFIMRVLREFYDKYPMITVRLISFFGGIPLICIFFVLIHELFGIKVYQYLYAPILAFLASVYVYFLRKATLVHIYKELPWSNKHRFYSFYRGFLGVISVIFLITSICGLIGLL